MTKGTRRGRSALVIFHEELKWGEDLDLMALPPCNTWRKSGSSLRVKHRKTGIDCIELILFRRDLKVINHHFFAISVAFWEPTL